MFIAIGLMLLGVLLGRLLRGQRWIGALSRCISPAIVLLLFFLGVAVGGNEQLMRNLPLLGGKALLLSLAGVAGSLLCVAVIRRWFRDFPPAPGAEGASKPPVAPAEAQPPHGGQ